MNKPLESPLKQPCIVCGEDAEDFMNTCMNCDEESLEIYWYIDFFMLDVCSYPDEGSPMDQANKLLGNYFESETEAYETLQFIIKTSDHKLKPLKTYNNKLKRVSLTTGAT